MRTPFLGNAEFKTRLSSQLRSAFYFACSGLISHFAAQETHNARSGRTFVLSFLIVCCITMRMVKSVQYWVCARNTTETTQDPRHIVCSPLLWLSATNIHEFHKLLKHTGTSRWALILSFTIQPRLKLQHIFPLLPPPSVSSLCPDVTSRHPSLPPTIPCLPPSDPYRPSSGARPPFRPQSGPPPWGSPDHHLCP